MVSFNTDKTQPKKMKKGFQTMKQNRTRRPIALIFSLLFAVSLIFAIFAMTSSAEDSASAPEYDYSIKSINISHSDNIQLLVAVNAPSEAGISVTYSFGNKEKVTANFWDMIDIDPNDGKEITYPVYYTEGISAKDMGEDIVVTVTHGDTTDTDSFSVARYLYVRLFELYKEYGDDFATLEDGAGEESDKAKDGGRKILYQNLLAYGANAQQVLWNNKYPDDQRTLVTDYTFVGIDSDGKIGSAAGAIIDENGKATLTYTGDDANFVGWELTTYEASGNYSEIVYGKNVSVSAPYGHVIAKPVIDATFEANTFDDLGVGDGIYVIGTEGTEGAYSNTERIEQNLPSYISQHC